MSPQTHPPTTFVKTLIGLLAVCVALASGPQARAAQAAAPALVPVFAGTPLPTFAPIQANNLDQLANVAQWGKGNLNAVAFAPDGQHFVAGSTFGLAVYDTAAPDRAPRWLPFDAPFWYNALYFSEDGNYLLLKGYLERYIYDVASGQQATTQVVAKWVNFDLADSNYGDISVVSPDGAKRFKSSMGYEFNMELFSEETVRREVYDTVHRALLYQLTDPVSYVTYSEHSEPAGCDISYVGHCGNPLMALASAPYKAVFSPSSASLAVMYRSPSLANSSRFSTLRLYNAADGALLTMLGSADLPVQDFAFAPNSQMLIVAFVNGALQLWDLTQQKMMFGTTAFATPIHALTYTHDGKYLITQHPDAVEIRRRSDGALWARHPAVTSALSPVENLLALADAEGVITLLDVNTGEVVRQIQAHTDTIFALAFSPDGQLLASSSQDCAIRLWDVRTGEFLHLFEETIINPYGEPDFASRIFIRYLRFVPGTNKLIGFGSWGTLVSWNVNSGATQYVIESAPLEYYNGMMTLDPHFPEFFSVNVERQRFYINDQTYDLQTGEALSEYQPPTTLPQGCAAGGERSADGTLLFTYGYDRHEGQVCVLDAYDHSLIQTLNVIPREGRDYTGISGLALSPDGAQLTVSAWGGMLYVYQVAP